MSERVEERGSQPQISLVPTLARIENYCIPMGLQTTYARNLAGNSIEFASLMVFSRSQKRIRRIEHEKNYRVLSEHPPPVPFNMPQLSVGWLRLFQDLRLIITGPYEPSGGAAYCDDPRIDYPQNRSAVAEVVPQGAVAPNTVINFVVGQFEYARIFCCKSVCSTLNTGGTTP